MKRQTATTVDLALADTLPADESGAFCVEIPTPDQIARFRAAVAYWESLAPKKAAP